MLQDLPKKKKDYSNPTKAQLFRRITGECFRRAVTPFLMYLFMSLIAFACQAINNTAAQITLGVFCILCGAAFNAHLCYTYGRTHYDAYATGCIHRRNAVFGIASGGDHRPEREYRVWKGFLIGLCTGAPVLIIGVFAHFFKGAELALMMIAGWSVFPIQWIRLALPGTSAAYSLLMVLLPVLVSGVFYIIGARLEKRKKEEQAARAERVAELAKEASEAQKQRQAQTEEQRRKTLQSKKKK